jgi:hypothetical protein
MGWPKLDTNIETLAASLSAQVYSVQAMVAAWRSAINTDSASDGLQAESCYQAMVSLRNFGTPIVAANSVALAAAYVRRNPALNNFEPSAEWTTLKTAIDNFVTWFQANWPKNAQGNPTFQQYNASGDLQSLSVPLGGAMKTTVLANLDAVLNAFT